MGSGGIAFDGENNQLVSSIRAIRIPQIFQDVIGMQEIAGTAPGSEDIDQDNLATVQVILNYMHIAVDIGKCQACWNFTAIN